MDRTWPGVHMDKLPGDRGILPDDKTFKIIFYLTLAFITIVVIMSLLAITYAGSVHPLDLLRYENFLFAYAGTPDYAYLYSDNLHVGLTGINGSTACLTLPGETTMTLYPANEIMLTLVNGTTFPLGARPVEAWTRSGRVATISINVSGEDDFDYGMHFRFNSSVPQRQSAIDRSDNMIQLKKKGNNQYAVINSNFNAGPKLFTLTNNSRYTYLITIEGSNLTVHGAPAGQVNRIRYTGQLNLTTNGDMSMKIPLSAMSAAGFCKLQLNGSDGHLDVAHNEYPCSPADKILILSYDKLTEDALYPEKYNSYVSLLNGNIEAHGQAAELSFRDRNFCQPLTVILKEGHLAIIVGLLSSFLTIMISKLIREFKKK